MGLRGETGRGRRRGRGRPVGEPQEWAGSQDEGLALAELGGVSCGGRSLRGGGAQLREGAGQGRGGRRQE